MMQWIEEPTRLLMEGGKLPETSSDNEGVCWREAGSHFDLHNRCSYAYWEVTKDG